MAQGFTDPLKSNSLDNVRFESSNDLGSPAMEFVKKADPARSILGDGAMAITRFRWDRANWRNETVAPR